MATNGNEPNKANVTTEQWNALQALAGKQPAVRGADAVGAGPREGGDEQPAYDLAAHVTGTAKALRDLADYSNNVAGDIERIMAAYINNMHRLMGKIGK